VVPDAAADPPTVTVHLGAGSSPSARRGCFAGE
jgi:hypothetical protein